MFSFLSKKKQSPSTPVEDIIQGPSSQNNTPDDFIFVEKKPNDDPGRPQTTAVYPPMPAPYPVPQYPYGPGSHYANNIASTPPPVSYVQDVPFTLAPQLCTKSSLAETQTEVDGILAILTRQMSMDAEQEYNFALERSIRNEEY